MGGVRERSPPAPAAAGIAAALRQLAAIAGWSVLTTTVGLLLRLFERATLGISRLVAGVAWSVAVFQHATGGPCFGGFPAGDLERPREDTGLRLLRRLRARKGNSQRRG